MGRKEFVYLGKRVPDIKQKGNLDALKELKGIRDAIVSDYKRGRISQRTAQGRMLLLYRIAKVDKDFEGRRRKALKIVEEGFEKLSEAIEKKKKSKRSRSRRSRKRKRKRR